MNIELIIFGSNIIMYVMYIMQIFHARMDIAHELINDFYNKIKINIYVVGKS